MTDFELTKCCALYEFGCSNAAAKAVLVTLAAMTMSTGRVRGKTVDELCRACCVQRNAFLKAIAWLEEKGLIVVERHKAVASTYIFNEALLLSGGLVGSESVTKNEGYENDTKAKKVGYGFDTKLVTDTTPTQLRIRNQVSYASVTTYKKEKEKEKSAVNLSLEQEQRSTQSEPSSDFGAQDFASMSTEELLHFIGSHDHAQGIEARAEYTKRVKQSMNLRPDFEEPDRPHYEILGM